MSVELPDKPRKIGKHFTFTGCSIIEISNKICANVRYEYNGKHMKWRSMDPSHYLEDELLGKIVEPLSGKGYEIKDQHTPLPENRFKVTKNGNVFTVGHTVELYDKILAASTDGAPMSSFRGFLKNFEESMKNYKED